MAALPFPVAILDDLICGTRNEVIQDGDWKQKGRPFHPPPQQGSKKVPQVLDYIVISKMAALEMTSLGRRDSREDVLQTSAPLMSHPS